MNKKNARFIKKIKENPTLEALKLYYINEIKYNNNFKDSSKKVYQSLFFKSLKANFNKELIVKLKNELKG